MTEQHYIDIFKQNKDLLNAHSLPILNALREKALNSFSASGFPTKKLEDYKYINVASEFEKDFVFNLNGDDVKGNPYNNFKCEVPKLSTNLYYILNETFHKEFLPAYNYPKGVYVGSIKDFGDKHSDILEKHYGKAANIANSTVAFNSMFVRDGFIVYVPKGVIVETPIQLIHILQGENRLTNRRILVIAEDGAQVKILSCDHTIDEKRHMATQVTEIFAGRDSIVDFYEMEENSDFVTRLANTFVKQEESSNVLINNITLNNGTTRNNYYVTLGGEHAEAYVCGMVIADQQQYVDNFVFMDHAKPNCHSTQLFKYVLQENAKGAFCGRIVVEKDAQKTLAYQSNNNLCVSPNARMYSKPQLEIYADDVKCSHGLTTGQLDEDALFYLRSRGLPEVEARLMLMQAFTVEVLEHIRIPTLKDRLLELVERRFKGEMARCGNCIAYK